MSMLPSRDPAGVDGEPRVIPVDSDDADDVLGALSSETARALLARLNESPAPPGELADAVDTSLQNVQYHLEKLEGAGTVEVVDTAYSEKGREMDVYAPADQPLVICTGDDEQTSGVRSALTRFLGGVSALVFASAIVQVLFGRGGLLAPPELTTGQSDPTTRDTDLLANGTDGVTRTVRDVGTDGGRALADGGVQAAGAVPPGVAFLAGGLCVAACVGAVWYLRQ